ncbi:MAG: type II toxin-antitoxin system ParD family antitoxin [Candidatus Omnitrophota bacterium]|jgi:antitoxin ParD1/3/4|nr:MAG: type II toxin-antitoxin system ParD family antitoxin [Candidatus Omnitrophota bacterium]
MNIVLSPEQEQFVHEQIACGRYNSANDMIREALRLLEERNESSHHRFEELRREIAIGIEQADRGELVNGKEVFSKLRERNDAQIHPK